MRPFTYTVYELFEKDRRHIVPLFQRPYVWTLEGQWQPLWEDIITKADALLEGGRDSRNPLHFMGAAVLSEMKVFGKQVKAMAVIDGQQRLTTLQIILIALRDFVRHIDHDRRLLAKLEKLTQNDWREDENEMLKIWPTNADRDVFANIVRAGSREILENGYPLQRKSNSRKFIARPSLVEAYVYFYQQIKDYAFNRNDTTDSSNESLEFSADSLEAIFQTLSACCN